MARHAGGPEQVRKLDGSPQAKERLEVILETVAGQRSVEEACAVLHLTPSRFHELRRQALAGALGQLEPRPAGRPPHEVQEPPEEVEALRGQLSALRIELEASRIREEIAIAMPQLLRGRNAKDGAVEGVKKTSRGSPRRSARRSGTR